MATLPPVVVVVVVVDKSSESDICRLEVPLSPPPAPLIGTATEVVAFDSGRRDFGLCDDCCCNMERPASSSVEEESSPAFGRLLRLLVDLHLETK